MASLSIAREGASHIHRVGASGIRLKREKQRDMYNEKIFKREYLLPRVALRYEHGKFTPIL